MESGTLVSYQRLCSVYEFSVVSMHKPFGHQTNDRKRLQSRSARVGRRFGDSESRGAQLSHNSLGAL